MKISVLKKLKESKIFKHDSFSDYFLKTSISNSKLLKKNIEINLYLSLFSYKLLFLIFWLFRTLIILNVKLIIKSLRIVQAAERVGRVNDNPKKLASSPLITRPLPDAWSNLLHESIVICWFNIDPYFHIFASADRL